MIFRCILLLLGLSTLTGCLSSSQAPKQLISELETRGYVCEKRAPLGSRRQRLICKSPEQIKEEMRSIDRDKADYIYENPQMIDGVRLY